jgi:hypothetical protein
MYENRTRKSVEIKKREEGRGRMVEGVNLIKIHCNPYGNVTMKPPCTTNVC